TKTSIRAQGLEANLSGKLLVFQEPEGVLRGRGEITVNEGRYRAYGQDLKIDKGRLLFDGGSIDDPSLDLKAEKTVDSITAGVSIIGRASAPRLNLYSTPSMQDEDILSVLVFDKPLGKLGSQDGFTLLRIANSLRGDGSSQITKMTEKLQQSLGLTSLELQLTSNAPSLVAGKQLSSKFYVGYGYGLLDAAQSLILRYNLSEAWSIKADLGTDSGADLRYQIER
ncbi:MAG: translocation and assembly module TamB, partial [Arenicella sp.]